MIQLRPLKRLNLADLKRVASGYSSDSKYAVAYTELDKPYVKRVHYDDEILQQYNTVLSTGYSFGAYDGDLLVGLIIAEGHQWNRSLSVHEFHVAETHRKQNIGKRLMECVAEKASRVGLRTIVCETQNTNPTAISVYRKLGFRVEGIDISSTRTTIIPTGK